MRRRRHRGGDATARGLQWPNDLLLGERKCCGVLCISRVVGDEAWVGCGVGLNVLRPRNDQSLAGIEPPPAFLSDRAPWADRERVFEEILKKFEWFVELAGSARKRSGTRGNSVRACTERGIASYAQGSTEPFDGTAQYLSKDGGLVVEHDGIEETISLGEARVLRA